MKNNSEIKDEYAHGMDWGESKVSIGDLTNYREYQYNLVSEFGGRNILEVGCGASRSFTKQIISSNSNIEQLLSIEPSKILLNKYLANNKYKFPELNLV